MFDITPLVGHALSEIMIVDIGAMDVGGETSFSHLVDRGLARLIGFEPIEEECRKLNQQGVGNCRYVPAFIGDGDAHPFYVTRAPMSSSLYEPNLPLLRQFQHLEEYMQVTRAVQVQTRRLDDICEVQDVDLLKIDVDGAELDVFRGAGENFDHPDRSSFCSAVQARAVICRRRRFSTRGRVHVPPLRRTCRARTEAVDV